MKTYSRNNAFQYVIIDEPVLSISGSAIRVHNNDIGSESFSITVEDYNNFYDCTNGITVEGYNEINISSTNMRSTQMPISSLPDEGELGIFVETPYLDEMNITENVITNIRNGIVFLADIDGAAPPNQGQQIGPVLISENTIQATLDGNSSSPTDEYVLNGIIADNTLYAGLVTDYPTPIVIENNSLYQVHNGIHVQGWYYLLLTSTIGWQNRAFTLNNYISLRQIEFPDNTPQLQYGIFHLLNYSAWLENNNVQGFDNDNMLWIGVAALDYINANMFEPTVRCNTAENTGTGIYFGIPSNRYIFHDNTMDDNQFGYLLDGADIDEQGDDTYACGNRWLNYTSGNYKTYTMNGSDPNNSILWIDTGDPDQYPQGAFNGTTTPPDFYDVSNGLEPVTSNGNTTSCSPPQGLLAYGGGGNQRSGGYSFDDIAADTIAAINVFEQLATDSFTYAKFPAEQAIIAKHRAYMMLNLNPALKNSSATLQSFFTAADAGNVGKLFRTEKAISEGNLNDAQTWLNTVAPANTIEANYKAFYTAYLHMKQGAFTSADSAEISRLVHGCAPRDGIVVYQSRALHRILYKDFKTYFDDCPDAKQQAYKMMETDEKDILTENVVLYPNPSSGEVWFKLEGFNGNQVDVKVSNLEGALIHEETADIITENNKIQFDFSSGVYFVSVKTLERSHTKRVIIIK